MNDIEEEWKDVVGYEGYYKVSNLGRVKSLDRMVTRPKYGSFMVSGVILGINIGARGYVDVKLHVNGVRKGKLVHRLVAEAFIPNPEGKPYVNHDNGIKTDNSVTNLEWSTPSENAQHAVDTGLTQIPKGQYSGKTILLDEEVLEMCRLLDSGSRQKHLAEIYGVSRSIVSSINSGLRWNHLTNRRGNVELHNFNRGSTHAFAKSVINCRGEIFGSLAAAAKHHGIKDPRKITMACKGIRKSSGRYSDTKAKIKWKFLNDHEKIT